MDASGTGAVTVTLNGADILIWSISLISGDIIIEME